ncbi:MAG: hypothetical protein K2G93_00135, partial [Rikenella sp.]|nr:hypothetical protein [Rikenella sp.]
DKNGRFLFVITRLQYEAPYSTGAFHPAHGAFIQNTEEDPACTAFLSFFSFFLSGICYSWDFV